MQNELLNTKLSKKERKRIERLLVDYHRMPAKIESAKMRAEQAVTASYNVREGSGLSAPSDPTASIAMKREEIANMERLYKILADHRELMTDDELTIWDTVYHPRHQYSPQQAADALRASHLGALDLRRHGWVRPTLEPRSTNHIEPRVIPFPSFYKAYFEECLNTDELQKRFKCNHRVIKRTLDHHGIERMRRNERIKMKRQFEDSKGGR